MLQNAYLVAKIGADTAENDQQFAEILPIPPGARRPTVKLADWADELGTASQVVGPFIVLRILRCVKALR